MGDDKRSIGPVTLATSGSAAVVTVICWLVSLGNVDVPGPVQGALTVLVALVAGYAVPPARKGRYAA